MKRKWPIAGEPVTLFTSTDLARAYGVVPSAISNWFKRGSGPTLPDPAYVTSSGTPLWTAEQLRAIIADRRAALETQLTELDVKLERVPTAPIVPRA